jgi:hypothetical protein
VRNSRRLYRRPFPLCILGATALVGPVLRPALFCGPLFLSILNYRAANFPLIAAPFYVGVECPAALFYISAQPKPPIFGWLSITYNAWCVIGYKLRAWSVRPVPPAFHVAAFLLLSLPHLTSIIDICVLRVLHRVRAHLQYQHGNFNTARLKIKRMLILIYIPVV